MNPTNATDLPTAGADGGPRHSHKGSGKRVKKAIRHASQRGKHRK